MTFYLLSRIALSLFMTINIDDITLVLIFIQGKDMKLTIKQEKFCNYYLESGNASEAYRRAYSCENMRPETINIRACELLANGKIAVRVKELQTLGLCLIISLLCVNCKTNVKTYHFYII